MVISYYEKKQKIRYILTVLLLIIAFVKQIDNVTIDKN